MKRISIFKDVTPASVVGEGAKPLSDRSWEMQTCQAGNWRPDRRCIDGKESAKWEKANGDIVEFVIDERGYFQTAFVNTPEGYARKTAFNKAFEWGNHYEGLRCSPQCACRHPELYK